MILKEYFLNAVDAARLVAEACEGLEKRIAGLERTELVVLLRRVVTEGVTAVKKAEETVSFAEAVRLSLEARRELRPTSRRNLRHYTNRMLRVPGVAERPLRAMSVKECRALLATAFGNSPSSYHKGRAILHSVFAFGVRQEWCDRNPVAAIEAPRVKERPIEPLTPDEVARLEHTAERPEFRDMQLSLQLMLYCGIRPTEVTRLDPQRDIVGNELIIRPQTSKTGGGRVIPLRKVAAFIRRHKEELIIPKRWEQRWRDLRRASRLRNWRADTCRHTFAAYHIAYFKNMNALQQEMGHTTPRLLHSRYLSPVPAQKARRFWMGDTSAEERVKL